MTATSDSPPASWPDPRIGAVGLAVLAAALALATAWGAPPAPVGGLSALSASAAALLFGLRRRELVPAMPGPAPVPLPPPPPSVDSLGDVAVAALELLPDPVMIVSGGDADDLAGRRIRFANAAARTLLRLPREGGLLVAAVRRPEVLEAVDESLYGRIPMSAAFDIAAAQDRAWRLWTWPLGRDPADEPAYPAERRALVVLRDETDARRAERTRVDFLANASHELRTPLASLAGFIETLRGHAKDDPVARDRFLAIMADQAGRMRRLTEDLLSLSRAELNEHLPPTGVCDLSGVAADIVAALAPLAQERGVGVDVKLAPSGAALCRGERDQMLQVAQNLLDNALKHAPSGSRVVLETVAARPAIEATAPDPARPLAEAPDGGRVALLSPDRDGEGRYVALSVSDAGAGMERLQLPRLADRFFRIEGQKSGAKAGTGLGLAIVKHILNRHGGGLVVESAPGRGSRFIAYVPAATRPPDGVTETS